MADVVLALDFLAVGLRGLVIAIMLGRGMHRTYTAFFSYLSFSILASIARVLVRSNYVAGYYVYWATEAVYALLSFIVIYEAFWHSFKDFFRLRDFRSLLAVSIVVAAILIFVAHLNYAHFNGPPLVSEILSVALAVRLFQVGAFAIFLGFVVFLQTRRRRYETGIVAGYGLYAMVQLVTFILLPLDHGHRSFASIAPAIAYDCATVIWLWAFAHAQTKLTIEQYLGVRGASEVAPRLGDLASAYRNFAGKRWIG